MLPVLQNSCQHRGCSKRPYSVTIVPNFTLILPTHRNYTTAFDLGKYDVVITHYEHVQRQLSAKQRFEASHSGAARKSLSPPPLLSLLSDIHSHYGKPFQYIILDESQFANKLSGLDHQAITMIPCNGIILVSGTHLETNSKSLQRL